MSFNRTVCCGLLLVMIGCGGGGGGGGSNNPPANPPSGGSGGGGSAGGSSITTGGLVSGGVRVTLDSGAVGVSLDVAVGGTGLVAGDIQGFGSVIVNNVTSNTDDAEFFIEGESGTQGDLKQGQQVLILSEISTNTANQVLYRANIKGPVTAVNIQDVTLGLATLTVLGQSVLTDGATTFSNVHLANIVVGNELEVSGTVEDGGEIVASFIELKSALPEYALPEYKVTGQISALTATEFQMGGLTVDYSNAVLRDFDAGSIADSDVVEVKALPGAFTAPATGPAQMEASEVERLPILTVGGDAEVQVEGFIDRFESSSDFDVQTTPITIDANTEFENGDATSLGLGVKVQIEGRANGSGAILAEEITVQPRGTIRAEGNIEGLTSSPQTVTVLGVTFQIRDLTELEDNSNTDVDPLTFTDLGIGDEVEIRGYLDGSLVVATSLEREEFADEARLRGLVSAVDASGASFVLQGVTVNVQDGITDFEDAQENTVNQSEFFNALRVGDVVSVRWNAFIDTASVADEVSIED